MAYPDVVEARVVGDLAFSVRFADGVEGRVLLRPSHLYGVFERLRDPLFFNRLAVTEGFVSWPDDIDLAPDAMYEAIRRDGTWVLK
ncbi:MAG: DUF2442 domain-containing protein [Magnetospirillum sp.]|nr:DUF2442 domain-containing protein [Magnetospirillum sp.]